ISPSVCLGLPRLRCSGVRVGTGVGGLPFRGFDFWLVPLWRVVLTRCPPVPSSNRLSLWGQTRMVYEGPVGPKMVTGLFFFSPGNCPGCMLYFFVVLLDGNLGFPEVVYRLSFPYIVFFIISSRT